MKVFQYFFVFMMCSKCFLFSQTIDDLSDDQKKEVNRKRLSIEVIGHTSMSRDPLFGNYEATTTKKWSAYQGFNTPISEEQFFSLAGYTEEALKAKQYKEKGKKLLIGGIVASLAGTLMMYYTTEEEVYDSDLGYSYPETKWPLFYPGMILSLGGIGVGYFGLQLQLSNWAPYSTVRDISDEYNKKLIIYIYKNL